MVPGVGLEPTRYCYHQSLSLARLPISPPRHVGGRSVTLANAPKGVNACEPMLYNCGLFPFGRAARHMSQSAPNPSGLSYRLSDFDYELPPEQIAQTPLAERSASRLLQVTTIGAPIERRFAELPDLLRAGDVLVLNDTAVVKARLYARKDSGGQAEILLERIEDSCIALCQVRVSKALQPGRKLLVGETSGTQADSAATAESIEVLGREGQFYRLVFPRAVVDVLAEHGEVPLPPYIRPDAQAPDAEDSLDSMTHEARYQTVYAKQPGAVAAPTAGLHFTVELLAAIKARGVEIVYLTLHVGSGTFQTVRTENLAEHQMHEERYRIAPATAAAVAGCAGRVVAVGTTAVRALEAAAAAGHLVRPDIAANHSQSLHKQPPHRQPIEGATDLFITPGYRFQIVDALITNFHLPGSTLLMLVSAFLGYETTMAAYRHAVAAQYRFFSYGDAMFIPQRLVLPTLAEPEPPATVQSTPQSTPQSAQQKDEPHQ